MPTIIISLWKEYLQKIKNCHLDETDSKFGADPELRISVFGYKIYYCKAPFTWKYKAGQSVTISSTKAEYVALSEITNEDMFVKQVLETMGIKHNIPILVKVDNVGAIYLRNNHSLSQHTKHIDILHHFVT
jgi:hypothetical protein